MKRGATTRAFALVLVATVLVACSSVVDGRPGDQVRRALDRVVAHDLVGASSLVCAERRNPRDFPFSIGGIFFAVQALPGFDVPRTLSVMELDIRRIGAVETSVGADAAEVAVTGTLGIRFDPPAVEALFRAMAAESGQPVDEDLLAETMANVSAGDLELPVDETVPLALENGAWRICPAAPTP